MTDDSKIERVAHSLKGSGKEHRGESGEAGRGASVGSAGGVGVQAPVATREPVEHVIHGDRRVDHYAWLKNRKGPRVKEYLEAENVYADAMTRSTEYCLTKQRSRSLTMVRPGRPKMSPIKRMRKPCSEEYFRGYHALFWWTAQQRESSGNFSLGSTETRRKAIEHCKITFLPAIVIPSKARDL